MRTTCIESSQRQLELAAAGCSVRATLLSSVSLRCSLNNASIVCADEWTNPLDPGSSFQKVAYIFKFHRDGVDYYGGVGFNHVEAPTVQFLAEGTNAQGQPVRCTPSYGSDCAETNSLAILGQGLSDLIMGEPLRQACCRLPRAASDLVRSWGQLRATRDPVA